MAEKIKAEIELIPVWVRDGEGPYLERWTIDCIKKYNISFTDHPHSVKDVNVIIEASRHTWDELWSTDPHTPKVPEWMPGEGFELWERLEADYGTIRYKESGKAVFYINPESKSRFHSFAVQAGDGTIELKKTPNWFTEEGEAHLYLTDQGGSIDAVVLGCVMRKAVE